MFKEATEKLGESFRTRLLPELVKNKLIKEGVDEDQAHIVAETISGLGAKKKRTDEKLITKQIMFFSSAEVDNIVAILKEEIAGAKSLEDVKKKLEKFDYEKKVEVSGEQAITPDIALFGRMITSVAFPDIEASIQVAHALSTNKMEHEFDYFTAVDDLIESSETIDSQGAGMIGDVEFNSACYYKYISLDFNAFLENMGISREIDKILKDQLIKVVIAFLKAATFVTPSGKQNTFAAHQLPDAILVELRKEKIQISYANAFIKPVTPKGTKDLMEASLEKFSNYVSILNKKYSLPSESRLWFCTAEVEIENAIKCETFDDLAKQLKQSLQG